jgi:hypothetical protein
MRLTLPFLYDLYISLLCFRRHRKNHPKYFFAGHTVQIKATVVNFITKPRRGMHLNAGFFIAKPISVTEEKSTSDKSLRSVLKRTVLLFFSSKVLTWSF